MSAPAPLPLFDALGARLWLGDCRDVLAAFDAETFDSVVTDPPYELGFMGKTWDASGVAFDPATWRAVLRVMKPGAHLVAFGGTRTYHRIAVAIEDAGFEIRDGIGHAYDVADDVRAQWDTLTTDEQHGAALFLASLGGGPLAWMYGSGFPKSHDVSKAIDAAAGAVRDVVGPGRWNDVKGTADQSACIIRPGGKHDETAPATDAARQWDGWGTALKPAWEPIILARKPLRGTVAANVLAHGTGALNVDACRVGSDDTRKTRDLGSFGRLNDDGWQPKPGVNGSDAGRWPANVVLSHRDDCAETCAPGCPVALLDAQSGATGAAAPASGPTLRSVTEATPAYGRRRGLAGDPSYHADAGGASRFFYNAKASQGERHAGVRGVPAARDTTREEGRPGGDNPRNRGAKPVKNHHPTVKPVDLMRWLVRLVTPPGGRVLDPFNGSGSTGVAVLAEHMGYDGIDRDADYLAITADRLTHAVHDGAAATLPPLL